jgi:putative protease
MRKTGGTPFAVRGFNLDYGGGMFAPVAELNRMRREFLKTAGDALIKESRPPDTEIGLARARIDELARRFSTPGSPRRHHALKPPALSIYCDSIEVAKGAAGAAGCDTIVFEPWSGGVAPPCCRTALPPPIEEQLLAVLAICNEAKIPLVWKLPRITGKPELDRVCALLPLLRNKGLASCMVDSTGAAAALRDVVPEMQVAGSAGLNIFNHMTVKSLAPRFFRLTVSPELSIPEIAELVRLARQEGCSTEFELIAQGNAETMVSFDCLLQPHILCKAGAGDSSAPQIFTGVRDSTGRIFPVRTDGSCRTHLFNAVETCLLDHIPSLVQAGIGVVAIDARGRTPAYAEKMVGFYREAIRIAQQDSPVSQTRLMQLKEQVIAVSLGGITAGHSVRGLDES